MRAGEYDDESDEVKKRKNSPNTVSFPKKKSEPTGGIALQTREEITD